MKSKKLFILLITLMHSWTLGYVNLEFKISYDINTGTIAYDYEMTPHKSSYSSQAEEAAMFFLTSTMTGITKECFTEYLERRAFTPEKKEALINAFIQNAHNNEALAQAILKEQ